MNNTFDVLVIGAGPCGIRTAELLSKENISIGIIEKDAPGGKVNIAPRVDNYPPYEKILGPDLAYKFYERLMASKAEFIGDEVIDFEKVDNKFIVKGLNGTYASKALVIATGTKEKKLGLPREDYFFGKGLSYCAVCDGHFYRNKVAAIVGGGDSALKEAIYLAPIVSKLYLINRRNEFRAQQVLLDELKSFSNVEILTPYIVTSLNGDEELTSINVRNIDTNEEKVIELSGFFPVVGQNPNTSFIRYKELMDENGNVYSFEDCAAPMSGVFAGGDVVPRDERQIYIAERDAEYIAMGVMKYLAYEE